MRRPFIIALTLLLAASAHAIEFDGLPPTGDTFGPPDKLAATSCLDGTKTGADGTVTCEDPPGPVEFTGSTMLAGTGGVTAYAVVMMSSTANTVLEATTSAVSVLGCSGSSSTVSSGNPLTVEFTGRVKCKAGTVTKNRRVGIGSTGQLENATSSMFTVGVALEDSSSGTVDVLFDPWAANSRQLVWVVNKTASLGTFSAVKWNGTTANEVVVANAYTDDQWVLGIAQNAVTAAVDDVIPVLISGVGFARASFIIANQEFAINPGGSGIIEPCCPTGSPRVLGRALGTTFSEATIPVMVYSGAPQRRHAIVADFPAAGCNAATASPVLDIGSSSAPEATCLGTNYPRGVLGFDDASAEYAYASLRLPVPFYAPGTLWARVELWWYSSATSGNVKWNVDAVCIGDSDPEDPTFGNTTATTTTAADTGGTLDANLTAITWSNAAMLTGCDGGDVMHLRIWRDGGNGSDTMTGDALLGRVVVMDPL